MYQIFSHFIGRRRHAIHLHVNSFGFTGEWEEIVRFIIFWPIKSWIK